jgi:D-aminoacyl-tRNA deacylase
MQYAIIISKQDPAGLNIKECLLRLYPFEKKITENNVEIYVYSNNIHLYTLDDYSVFAEQIDRKPSADFFIFATRHQSKEGVHSLSCHAPGNWSKAGFGGEDKKLCIAPALMLKKAYLELKKHQNEVSNHQITLEATHHGPFMEKPVMFIEIGSTEEHWGNKKAGEIIAHVIINLVLSPQLENQKIALGIGGPHYCNNFNKVLERTDIAVGHICPKHMLEKLDEEMIRQALKETKENVDFILLDWKGMGKEKERIKVICENIGIEIRRTDQILK